MGTTSGGGGVTTVGVVSGSQQISPGILTQIALRSNKVFQPLGEQFWSLHLGFDTTVDDGIVATLVAGYIQYPNALTWHGFLEIPATQFMLIEGVGINTQIANALETRLTLTMDGKLTDYLIKIQREGRL